MSPRDKRQDTTRDLSEEYGGWRRAHHWLMQRSKSTTLFSADGPQMDSANGYVNSPRFRPVLEPTRSAASCG